ncbi:MAG: energy transducer TonB [Candidatus Aminicenantes bacterium]|nr:MAG: energy transducer TonB [Candidatus Aminicenantes bacterium]
MNKKNLSIFVILLMVFSTLPLQASVTLYLKLRFFEGLREGAAEPPRSISSSHLQSTVAASIRSKFILAEEIEQIKKVFNLKEVRLITEGDLSWNSKDSKGISHLFRLDGKIYRILITPTEQDRSHQFKIEIFEQDKKGEISLLDTEIILPEENIAVFGFEDKQGKPYFLSFHIPERAAGGEVGGVVGGVVQVGKDKDFAKGAVRAVGQIKPPKLLKLVEPAYPEEARKEGVEGVVILEARTNKEGNVEAVQVLRGIDPYLNKAAMDALLQWKYEPMYIKGEPHGVVFTVTVRFGLKDKDEEKAREMEDFAKGAIELGEDEKPKIIKKADPVYPEELRKEGIQGRVILKIRLDEQGRVAKVRVISSDSSLLNKPAVDAVRQWKFEVYHSKGKPQSVVFPVKVIFKLR